MNIGAFPSPRRFDALVIGASAGGVHALQALLSGLDARWKLPILIVLHVPRDRPSRLAPLLDELCVLPVAEAVDKQPLQAATVTVAPPDYHLLVETRDCLALSRDADVLFSRPAIDPLFESAAAVFGERLLALLLTGASSDGTDGVAAVRAVGGTVWIQDPKEAASPLMPASALAGPGADAVLTLSAIGDALKDIVQ
jgi:two-component system, chemotaxis family, protein-glutamate methylesterase/glutaminase